MHGLTTAILGGAVVLALGAAHPASATTVAPAQYGQSHAGPIQDIGYRRRWVRRWGPAYGYRYGYRPYGYYRPYAYAAPYGYYGRPYGYYGRPYAYYGGPYGYYGRPGISLGFAF